MHLPVDVAVSVPVCLLVYVPPVCAPACYAPACALACTPTCAIACAPTCVYSSDCVRQRLPVPLRMAVRLPLRLACEAAGAPALTPIQIRVRLLPASETATF